MLASGAPAFAALPGAAPAPATPTSARISGDVKSGAWQRNVARTVNVLKTGAFVGHATRPSTGLGENQIRSIQLPGSEEQVGALVKPAGGEARHALYDAQNSLYQGSPYGKGFQREVAASLVDQAWSLGFVPPTAHRVLEAPGRAPENASVQLMVSGALVSNSPQRNPALQLNRAAAEKLRAFDYVMGNRDRTAGNLFLYEKNGEYHPIAIDNGLSLPERPMYDDVFVTPLGLTKDQTGPLLGETVAFLRGIDAQKTARALHRSGVSRAAAQHALRRLEHVKTTPSILEFQAGDVATAQGGVAGTIKNLALEGSRADQRLSPAALQKIDQLLDDVYGVAR